MKWLQFLGNRMTVELSMLTCIQDTITGHLGQSPGFNPSILCSLFPKWALFLFLLCHLIWLSLWYLLSKITRGQQSMHSKWLNNAVLLFVETRLNWFWLAFRRPCTPPQVFTVILNNYCSAEAAVVGSTADNIVRSPDMMYWWEEWYLHLSTDT